MKNIFTFILFGFLVIPLIQINAQEIEHKNSKEEEHKKDPGLEIVLSGLFVYNSESENFDPATELHITYWTSHKWAFGVGYSIVFEEDNRIGHELAVLVSHKPWSFLTINIGPSFSLPNSHNDTEVAAYIEGEFNFKLGEFHIGPLIGTLIGENVRPFAGIHLGYEF